MPARPHQGPPPCLLSAAHSLGASRLRLRLRLLRPHRSLGALEIPLIVPQGLRPGLKAGVPGGTQYSLRPLGAASFHIQNPTSKIQNPHSAAHSLRSGLWLFLFLYPGLTPWAKSWRPWRDSEFRVPAARLSRATGWHPLGAMRHAPPAPPGRSWLLNCPLYISVAVFFGNREIRHRGRFLASHAGDSVLPGLSSSGGSRCARRRRGRL